MPVNPQIPLGALSGMNRVQPFDPLEAIQRMEQIKALRAGGDDRAALAQLREQQIRASEQQVMAGQQKMGLEARQADITAQKTLYEMTQERLKLLPMIAPYVKPVVQYMQKPETYGEGRQLLSGLAGLVNAEELVAKIPEQYSPEAAAFVDQIPAWLQGQLKEADVLGAMLDNATKANNGKPLSNEQMSAVVQQLAQAKHVPTPSAQAEAKIGSLEDYLVRKYGPTPTPEQIREGKVEFEQKGGEELTTVITQRPDPKSGNVIVEGTGMTANTIFQNAMKYAMEGKMPSLGLGSAGRIANARMAIQNTAGALAAAAGVDMPLLVAEYRANSTSLNRMVPLYNQTTAYAESAMSSMDYAQESSNRVYRSDVPAANRVKNWWGTEVVGNGPLSEFEVFVFTAARDYAKVTSGGALSIAELSVEAAKQADKLLNAAQSPDMFNKAIGAMKRDMSNVMDSQREQIGKVSETIAKFLDATNPKPITSQDYAERFTRPQGQQVAPKAVTETTQYGVIDPRDGQWKPVRDRAAMEAAVMESGGSFKAAPKGAVSSATTQDEPGAIYKTTAHGKFKSVDGGLNWTKVGG